MEQTSIQWFHIFIIVFLALLLWSFYMVNYERLVTGYHAFSAKNETEIGLVRATPFNTTNEVNETRIILGWTTWFGFNLDTIFSLQGCDPSIKCRITSNHSLLRIAHALVFHMPDLSYKNYPEWRGGFQRYVLLNHESPLKSGFKEHQLPPNFINWTMTYRRDSDIYYPYGFFAGASRIMYGYESAKYSTYNASGTDLTGVVSAKTKLGLWIASGCSSHSKRETIIKFLQSKFPSVIDVWGACGNKTACSKEDAKTCEQKLMNGHYKFYFAFENSICMDYVTEKFWMRFHYHIVPVVLKRQILAPFAPANSFIAVDDFGDDLNELANYLRVLDGNATLYINYLRAKVDVKRGKFLDYSSFGFCKLCQELWKVRKDKFYDNAALQQWWSKDKCQNSTVN